MSEIIRINTIKDFCDRYGFKQLHDLVTIIDYADLASIKHEIFSFGFFAIFLKGNFEGYITYGLSKYSYDEGALLFVGPNQVFGIDGDGVDTNPTGKALLFHPNLLNGLAVQDVIRKHLLFTYETNDALPLNDEQRAVVLQSINAIKSELANKPDNHTRNIVAANVLVLMANCGRYYEQMIAERNEIKDELFTRFNEILNDYFTSGLAERKGLPTVHYCAEQLSLSPNYFGDLIKRLIGRSPKEHIQQVTVEHIKEMLDNRKMTISEISYKTGFKYPHHLSRVFKKITGLTPHEYRKRQ